MRIFQTLYDLLQYSLYLNNQKCFEACFRPIYKGKTTLLLTTHGGLLDRKLSRPQSQVGHAGEEKVPYPCWELNLLIHFIT